mmetsp:Transcript_3633/g.7055  ORF Transcript_3633/g.7055 Transcript_3633/m.7055 type:complete len:211 (-) Transcript_3633:2059-2691(-)
MFMSRCTLTCCAYCNRPKILRIAISRRARSPPCTPTRTAMLRCIAAARSLASVFMSASFFASSAALSSSTTIGDGEGVPSLFSRPALRSALPSASMLSEPLFGAGKRPRLITSSEGEAEGSPRSWNMENMPGAREPPPGPATIIAVPGPPAPGNAPMGPEDTPPRREKEKLIKPVGSSNISTGGVARERFSYSSSRALDSIYKVWKQRKK